MALGTSALSRVQALGVAWHWGVTLQPALGFHAGFLGPEGERLHCGHCIGDTFSQTSAGRYQPFGSLGGTAVHCESLSLLKACSNFVHFFLSSSGSWCSESQHFLPSWFITAGKMRDFWGQMCFHSTIIMPLKILIALAVFLGGPWAGPAQLGRRRLRSELLQQLREDSKVFPPVLPSGP